MISAQLVKKIDVECFAAGDFRDEAVQHVRRQEGQAVRHSQALPHPGDYFISHIVILKSFLKSQLPHKYVNLSFAVANIKNKLTDLCGNGLLQTHFKNTLSEIIFTLELHPTQDIIWFE